MPRTILITGASTGIGAAIARQLAPGNRLLLHHNRTSIDPVASAVQERGGTVLSFQADLMHESGCRKLMDEVWVQTGSLDVLINNAGALLKRHKVTTLEWGPHREDLSLEHVLCHVGHAPCRTITA